MSDSRADLAERASAIARRKASESSAANGVDLRPQHPVLRLQRQVGNAQVARMLQRAGEEDAIQMKRDTSIQRESEGGEEEEEAVQMKRDTAIQREDEGGEVEEEAIQMKRDSSIQRESEGGEEEEEAVQMKRDASIQRESEGGEEEEEAVQMKRDAALQRKAGVGLEGGELDQQLSATIDSKVGTGSSLDAGVRKTAEAAMGTSFEGVKVHRDADSDSLNRNMTAKAFTTGNDIFLRQDQNPADTSLMAHELTHVVQQRSMPSSGVQGKMVGPAGDQYEQEADRVAEKVVAGGAQRAQDEEHAH